MPTAADQLTPESTPDQVQTAISSCIQQMAGEHPDWEPERHQAACYSMAERATGKSMAASTPGVGRKTSRRIGL